MLISHYVHAALVPAGPSAYLVKIFFGHFIKGNICKKKVEKRCKNNGKPHVGVEPTTL
jgi:hypothetical protein